MNEKSKYPNISKFILPSLGEILFIAIFAALIGLGPRLMNLDGDLGRHITLGNHILTSRSVPTEDIFSHTKLGDPLTPHEWLADVVFAVFHRAAGLNGVVWITALVVGLTFWCVYQHSLNLSSMSLLAVAGTVLAAAASSLHWLARPHIFTIFLVTIWTAELEKMRLGIRKNWFIFPLVMLFWVNVHGAFLAGIMVWGMYFTGLLLDRNFPWERIKAFLWIGISSLVVTLLNPDGIGIWKTGFGFLGNQYLVSHTVEYLPPDFQQPGTWPFLLLIVLTVGILAYSKKKLKTPHVFLIAGWTAMALYSARHIPLYAVTVVPILVSVTADIVRDQKSAIFSQKLISFQEGLMGIEKELKSGFWSIISLIIAGLLLISGYKLDFQKKGNIFLENVFPVDAVNWMVDNPPQGDGFNYFPWGGYLLYRIWPENLVFIDGQTDFYGEELTRKYEQVLTVSDGWEKVLQEYKIQWVLMPAQSKLIMHLESLGEWQIAYQDPEAILMILKESQ